MDDPILFISYRRRDADNYVAEKLHDKLAAEFGKERIFKDTEAIPLGVDWHDHIDAQLAVCAVMLVVIGPSWDGQKDRLHNEDDMVRYEIAKALTDPGITVIPLMVDDTKLPDESLLPEDLHDLLRRNGTALLQPYFDHIVSERLIPQLRRLLPPPKPTRKIKAPTANALLAMDIRAIQTHLARQGFDPGEVDGKLGPQTRRAVYAFQKSRGLPADAIPGPQTVMELARRKGRSVMEIQERLIELGFNTGGADGKMGPATRTAIKRFQTSHGLGADGIVGPATLIQMFDE